MPETVTQHIKCNAAVLKSSRRSDVADTLEASGDHDYGTTRGRL